MDQSTTGKYGYRVRTRVCGLCWDNGKLLLVNHHGLYGHDFWSPPGGGTEWNQTAQENLVREFDEETGLVISPREFLFACELIKPPLHAIELFFDVKVTGGKLITGVDPEFTGQNQIINEVRYFSTDEIGRLPENHRHGVFGYAIEQEKLTALRGYLTI